jgi:hypothetical protein
MKQTLLFFLILFFLFSEHIFSQTPKYVEMMNDVTYNYYDVCDSAEAYFKNRDKGKGTGYKPYLRWKYNNEGRFFPSGDRKVDYYMPYREFERIKSADPNASRLFTSGGWQPLGPDTVGILTGHYSVGLGRVEYVEVNRNNDQQIYMGSRSGGLWKTMNEGASWSHNTDFLPGSGVNAISASPSNFDSVLINVRTADQAISFGIYRSTDGGATFTQTAFNPTNLGFGGLGSNFRIFVIQYHPRVPNLVFVGTSEGIYRSADNLQTWTRLLATSDVYDIEFHPVNNNILYVYDGVGGNNNKILRSLNQGISYTALTALPGSTGSRINISTSPLCVDCIFAVSSDGIWKSFNQGNTFSTTVSPAPAGVSLFSGLINDLDTSKFVGGYVDMYRNLGSAQTFTQCTWWSLGSPVHGGGNFTQKFNNSSNYTHADNNYLDCVNGIFYSCSDGFLSKSADNGISWQKLSLATGIRENYNVGTSQSDHYKSICGSQDNGTSIRTENGWIEFYGADGMEGIIHPLNGNYMIGSVQYGTRQRTLDGGMSNGGVTPSGQSGSWIAPMFYDPNNHMTVYSFATQVSKSTDFGSTWTTLGTASTFSNQTSDFATIAENNTNLIVMSRGDKIELSTNGGVTFTSIKNNLPTLSISDIAFDPHRDSTLIVTYNGYQNNGQKVFISKNLGATWTNITYNLGNMPVYCVLIDHTNASTIYLGAEIGVYKKAMNATTWSLYNPNLPNMTIKEMEMNYGSNTIKAAGWGRGLWEYTLDNRATYPAVLKTSITSDVTFNAPKESVNQFVTSKISYTGALTSVYVLWAVNTPSFTTANMIPMSLASGTTWQSNAALPNYPAGTNMYFKVFAIGNAGDTTETYKFMYTVKPFQYCAASGESTSGNLFINRFRCANLDNSGTANNGYTHYTNTPIIVYRDSAYTAIGNFNYVFQNANDFFVWLDYNGDAEFTLSERIVANTNITTGSVYQSQGTFTVPATAIEDTVRIRARYGYWGGYDDPCGTTLGEVEDYNVIIRQAPTIAFTGSTSFCVGSNFNFAYNGTAVDSIKWVLSNGTNTYTVNGNGVTTSALPAGTYSVALTGYKYALPFKKTYGNYVVVNSLPVITAASGTVCAGSFFTMLPSGATSYTYSGGSAVVSPATSTQYTISGTANGCVGSKTIQVAVNSLPVITAANGSICAGESFTMMPSGASSYTYSSGSVVSPSATTTYTITGTAANGCVGSKVVTVAVDAVPSLAAPQGTVCAGSSFTITPSGAASYTYSGGSAVVAPSVNTTYTVTGASANGCTASTLVTVSVKPLPVVGIASSNSLICIGESATLTASGAVSYGWNSGSSASQIVVSPTITTAYTAIGTGTNGCQASATYQVNVSACTGVADAKDLSGEDIEIYPNPATNELWVSAKHAIERVSLKNAAGQQLKDILVQDVKKMIPLADVANGVYFITVTMKEGGSLTRKIVVMK